MLSMALPVSAVRRCPKPAGVAALRSPRPLTPNLRSRADTCTETVFGLMNSAVAMSRFDSPATTWPKI
jgi:hypothetical protein